MKNSDWVYPPCHTGESDGFSHLCDRMTQPSINPAEFDTMTQQAAMFDGPAQDVVALRLALHESCAARTTLKKA